MATSCLGSPKVPHTFLLHDSELCGIALMISPLFWALCLIPYLSCYVFHTFLISSPTSPPLIETPSPLWSHCHVVLTLLPPQIIWWSLRAGDKTFSDFTFPMPATVPDSEETPSVLMEGENGWLRSHLLVHTSKGLSGNSKHLQRGLGVASLEGQLTEL
jgi:hypothetical protein